jgi:flagellin-like hook-associated protein FlgL
MVISSASGNNFVGISSFIAQNARVLQRSLVNIGAGQKIMNPSDGIGDYFVGNSYNIMAKEYETARRGMNQANIILDLASQSMGLIFDDLENIMNWAKDYFNPSTDNVTKSTIETKIAGLKGMISQTVDTTIFNNKKLLKDSSSDPLIEVSINPANINDMFSISFDASLEVNADGIDLTLGENAVIAEIQNQMDRVANYMGKLSGYKQGIYSQITLGEISETNHADAAKNILGLNEIDGIIAMTKRQIQQESAISMLAQGNMMRASVLNLIKF